MAVRDEFLIEDKLYEKDSVKIVFKPLIIFDHERIVNLLTNPAFSKSFSGRIDLKDFTVTTGGYDTERGFQYTVYGWFNSQVGKRVLHRGSEYPVQLSEGEYISKMQFDLVTKTRSFLVTISSHFMEIRPKPSSELVKSFIRKMKESLTESHTVFLKSARVKLNSAVLDFLGGRYRSVPHSIYYAVYDVVKALSIMSGMDSNIKHDKKAQERLTAVLSQVSSGKHKKFRESDVWREDKGLFKKIDLERYSRLILDLYEMRRMADYEKSFEIREFVPELSNLLLKAEELFGLTTYMEERSLVVGGRGRDEKIVLIFPQDRELSPDPYSSFGRYPPTKGEVEMLKEGMILAENFDLSKFLARFLRRKNILYSPFSSPRSWRRSFVKCEKNNGKWTFSETCDEEHAKEHGYIPYTIDGMKEISKLTKADEIAFLDSNEMIGARACTFSTRGHFFELYILSDGRFCISSRLTDQKTAEQVDATLKIAEMLAKDMAKQWPDCSSIAFSPISLAVGK